MNIESFIIENVDNISYIDSLLMALFYQPSQCDNILSKIINQPLLIYLQEYIKDKFISMIRNHKSILNNDMEKLKELCFQLGWKENNIFEYKKQQDVVEFYIFLTSLFEYDETKLIQLTLPEDKSIIMLKDLIYQFDDNSAKYPYMIALSLNRLNEQGYGLDISIDIQKKIYPYSKIITLDSPKWIFHAAICCHWSSKYKNYHYYTLLNLNHNKWAIFNNLKVPCLKEVFMNDKKIINKIKHECVFLFYKRA